MLYIRLMIHFKKTLGSLANQDIGVWAAVCIELDLCVRTLEDRLNSERSSIRGNEISHGLKFRMPFESKTIRIPRRISAFVVQPNLKSLLP